MSEDKEYLIDIASEYEYQNQDEAYHEAYTKWRMNENNRFGYKFIKDTREHTYAYGEGFEHNEASDAERKTLRDVSSLLGSVLLISAIIRLAQAVFDSRAGHLLSGAAIELTGDPRGIEAIAAAALSLFRPFSLLVCIIIYQSFVRLPKKVFLPANSKIPIAHTLCLLGTTAGVAIVCYIFSVFTGKILNSNFFSVTGGFVLTSSTALNLHYFINQYIISAVLHAIFINGLILQSLRQFGDTTAIVFSTVVEGLMAISFTKISTHLVMGLLFCFVTIKTGSIIAPIIARILTNCLFFALRYIDFTRSGHDAELFTLLLCIVILGIGMFSIGRLISFDSYELGVKKSATQLGFNEKVRTFFTTMPMIEWYAAGAVAWLYIVVA